MIWHAPLYDAQHVGRLLSLVVQEDLCEPPPPKKGFLTFFDPGASIKELHGSEGQFHFPFGWLRRLVKIHLPPPVFALQGWYLRASFAHATRPPAYRQLLMEPPSSTLGQTWNVQHRALAFGERVGDASTVVLGAIIHFLATGERLLWHCNVRTADVLPNGNRVAVGPFDKDGLWLADPNDRDKDYRLGIAIETII